MTKFSENLLTFTFKVVTCYVRNHFKYKENPMRSDMIKIGIDKAPARGLLYATGQVKSAKDFQNPFIAICNSYIDIVPGHVHLRELADVAKEAIREAGGIPFEFNTIGGDDGD